MIRAALIAAAAALASAVVPAAAHAQTLTYTARADAQNQTVDELAQLAVAFWAQRGHPLTCNPRFYLADKIAVDGVDDYGVAFPDTCEVLLDRELVAYVQAHPQDRPTGEALARVVNHEVGHLAGLEHAPGVMAPTVDKAPTAWSMVLWARDRARGWCSRWEQRHPAGMCFQSRDGWGLVRGTSA